MMMDNPADLGKAHLRVVRESDDLAPLIAFYRDGLGFQVLYEFKDHEGFDGVFLGHVEAAYHFAFVHKSGNPVGRAPTEDNLLVFYVPDADEWRRGVRRLEDHQLFLVGLAALHGVQPAELSAPPKFPSANVQIMVSDVDNYWQKAIQLGARVVVPIADRRYGLRDFMVADPDGFGVRFASRLESLAD